MRQLGTTLASTIQDIATDIIGGASASQDQPAAPVSLQIAVQLLRQLNQKGLLAQHPAYPTLQAAVGSALDSVQLSSGLEPVMVTVQVLLAQLQESASKRTDLLPAGIALFQQKYRMQFGEVGGYKTCVYVLLCVCRPCVCEREAFGHEATPLGQRSASLVVPACAYSR